MRKYDRGEIAKGILLALLATGAFVAILALPNLAQLLKYVDIKDGEIKIKLRRSARGLEKRGLIKVSGRGENSHISLTKKGTLEAMVYAVKKRNETNRRAWDGKWNVITFDIPEDKRSARRAFGKMLKRIGCFPYQKSIFITPFPCKKEIDFLGDYFGIRKHILLLTASKIENESAVQKYFNMNGK